MIGDAEEADLARVILALRLFIQGARGRAGLPVRGGIRGPGPLLTSARSGLFRLL